MIPAPTLDEVSIASPALPPGEKELSIQLSKVKSGAHGRAQEVPHMSSISVLVEFSISRALQTGEKQSGVEMF